MADATLAKNVAPGQTGNRQPTPLTSVAWGLAKQHKYVAVVLTVSTAWFSLLAMIKFAIETGLATLAARVLPAWAAAPARSLNKAFLLNTTSTDLLLGISSIFVGTFIATALERINEQKSDALQEETRRIREATDELNTKTATVAEQIKKAAEEAQRLQVITDYTTLLQRIRKLLEDARKSEGELLIMNLTAAFGYFMTFDADHVIETDHRDLQDAARVRTEKLGAMTPGYYFGLWKELLHLQQTSASVLQRIATGGRERPEPKKVTYITLRANDGAGSELPFLRKYLDPSLGNARVMTYDPAQSSDKFDTAKLSDPAKKLFLVPKSIVPGNGSDDISKEFKDHLIDQQRKDIRSLKDSLVDVIELDHIPFQLYVSLPPNRPVAPPGNCLFMFVNEHTLGRTNNLAAFETSDPEILGAFKSIIESVRQGQQQQQQQSQAPSS